jgi:peptidoglycan L-alanyl-D-glutamate endopeptidase CwlK
MINSRDIDELKPHVASLCSAFIKACDEQGIDIVITSTYRDSESQNVLYAQGRTKPGKKVTNAKAGQSYHQFRVAFDFVPIVHGKAQWNDISLFEKCGKIGKKLGMEWTGDWKIMKEYAHFQHTGGLTLADFQSGKNCS